MTLETGLRWTARVLGFAITLLLLQFAFGGREHFQPTPFEAMGFLFFPIGLIVGFVIAWWRDGLGGLISLASVALLYGWMFARDGRFPLAPYFLIFATPAFLHLACAWQASRRRESLPSV